MPLALTHVPGFADLPNQALGAESPAFAVNINRISDHAAFGMVRPEVFTGLYKNGDQVGLPQSPVDGYQYSISEVIFMWATQSSLNPSSGWITGPDTLWYCAWNVDQKTGSVQCIEYYRRSGWQHPNATQSNDGTLRVYTICTRQQSALVVANPVSTFTDITDATFATDAPLTQSMAQTLNQDAKFAILNSEAIYMGEFINGQTIAQPVSPADGYTYSYSQVRFAFSWRWTTTQSIFTQPPEFLGQLGMMKASINGATGAVTINVSMIDDSGALNPMTTYGRIMVVAFCERTMPTLPAIANAFSEIAAGVFAAGKTLRASTTLQLMKNIRESAASCEFFGPTVYANGNTVPLPTSPIDGYAYSRNEITVVWEWSDTTNNPGNHVRVPAFWGDVSQSTGAVTLRIWRMPPGGPQIEDGDSYPRITAWIVAQRGAQHPALTVTAANPASDIGSVVADNNPPDNAIYAVSYYAGQTGAPAASEVILTHSIAGNLSAVAWAAGLTGSYGGSVTAPTGAVTFSILKNGTPIGSINIAAGAVAATFTLSSAQTFAPGDIITVTAPASPDATLKGVWFTLGGTRT